MPLTPNSGASAYAAPTDLFNRYDARVIADLVGDTGVRTGGSPNPNLTTLATAVSATKCLESASGLVEAACLKGSRYSTTDLAAANGNSQQLLIDIVCAIAMGKLWRHKYETEWEHLDYKDAKEALAGLANGEMIFAFQEVEQAGVMTDYNETPDDVASRFLTTVQAQGLYGRRNNRSRWPGRVTDFGVPLDPRN